MMSKLSQRTITFLRKGRQVLLGYKNPDLGKGITLVLEGRLKQMKQMSKLLSGRLEKKSE